MKHYTTRNFWVFYRELPADIRKVADKNFAILREDPRYRSIHLKSVGQYWSARVGQNYRAVAKKRDEGLVWFWIGPHDQYKRLIS